VLTALLPVRPSASAVQHTFATRLETLVIAGKCGNLGRRRSWTTGATVALPFRYEHIMPRTD
jgi:hypothetical protein